MNDAPFDAAADRKSVTLSVNGDLLDRVRAAGVDVSGIVEAALQTALIEIDREKLRAEIAQDFRALEAYVEKHGDPVAELREMFGGFDAT